MGKARVDNKQCSTKENDTLFRVRRKIKGRGCTNVCVCAWTKEARQKYNDLIKSISTHKNKQTKFEHCQATN